MASRSSDAAPAWQEYNNLIQQIKTTTDLDEREAMMHQAEDMLMETGAILPVEEAAPLVRRLAPRALLDLLGASTADIVVDQG